MDLTSLQVCMDSSQWLQGTFMDEECGMDHPTSPCGGDMLTCSRPLNSGERRLRPQHDQALKCPRCDSTHTKFCYYNNYSLSQPRYFCKTCRRYWTKGGTLRNIPVGGGCRRNKKVSSTKKPTSDHHSHMNQSPNILNHHAGIFGSSSSTELQLSFPKLHPPAAAAAANNDNAGFMESKMCMNDIMERRLEAIVGSCSRSNYDFMGGNNNGPGDPFVGDHDHGLLAAPHAQLHHPYDGNNLMDMAWQQRMMMMMMLPDHQHDAMDVKPNTKLDWQDQLGRSETGYSWSTGMMNNNNNNNNNGPSTTNPLV